MISDISFIITNQSLSVLTIEREAYSILLLSAKTPKSIKTLPEVL